MRRRAEVILLYVVFGKEESLAHLKLFGDWRETAELVAGEARKTTTTVGCALEGSCGYVIGVRRRIVKAKNKQYFRIDALGSKTHT
jgi:hypothetical protein